MKMQAGVAVAVVDPAARRVLLLHRTLHWTGWEPVKGSVEKGESVEDAARREVREETGLELSSLVKLERRIAFTTPQGVERSLDCLIGLTTERAVRCGPEHDTSAWMSPGEARKRMTYPNLLPLLDDMEHFLSQTL